MRKVSGDFRAERGVDRVCEREHDRHASRAANREPHDRRLLEEALAMTDPDPVQRRRYDDAHVPVSGVASGDAIAMGRPALRSARKTRTSLAGSSSSTRSMTTRKSRARFWGVSTSHIP